ncbi:MAG: YidC/Oxa1 family membrane protein insertase, partial [Polaribacter sp.]
MEQKKFDVNSFIGMILLGGIIFWWMSTQEPEVDATTNTTTTSKVADAPETINNTVTAAAFENDSLKQINLQNKLGAFAQSAISASNGVSVLENEVVKLTIDNKGGQIKSALIKNFKTYDSLPLYMIKDNNASFNINFGTTDNRILNTKNLFFQPTITKNGDNQVVSMKLKVSETQFLEYRYEMKPKDYMVNFSVRSQGLSNVINASNPINLDWSLDGFRHEKSLKTENSMYSYYYFKSEEEVDYLNAGNSDVINDVDWVAYKQHFFSSSLLTDTPFNNATVTSTDLVLNEEIDTVFTKRYELKTPLELSNGELNYNMKWFYGPSDYNLLTTYEDTDLDQTADLGWGIFGFLNRTVFYPVFNFLKGILSNYGLIIILLTIVVRLIMSPLVYKSYLS